MIKVPISIDEDFERELQNLKRNYPYSYMSIVGIQPKQLDFAGYIRDFCETNIADNSVDGTSNRTTQDIVGLENDINKPMFKLIALNKIYVKLREKYSEEVANAWLASEYLGNSYLHDAHSATFIPYCYAYDLERLAKEGLFFLDYGAVPYNNKPAAHLDTFCNHIKEFVSFCCNRQAGAVGLPNLIPYMYYLWRKDIETGYNGCKLLKDGKTGAEDYNSADFNNQNIKYFMQCTQSIIYALNQPYLRNSVQSAFTNVSIFDHFYAHALFDGVTFPDGSLAFDHIDEIVEIQKFFMREVANIRHENMFTFPVLSFSLLLDDNSDFKDEEFAHWASDHNTEWFDSNFYLSHTVDALSNCCRLSSSIKDMMNEEGYFNSIGGSGLSVGSCKVNTVNMAHIAYEVVSETKLNYNTSGSLLRNYFKAAEDSYIEKLKKQVELNLMCLDVIRDIILTNKNKRHLLPNITDGLIDMKHMYCTIGVIGIYETLKTFQNKLDVIKKTLGCEDVTDFDYIRYDTFGYIYYTKNAEKFVERIFNDGIHAVLKQFKKENKLNYSLNVEQIPGETAASKLMKKDELMFPEIVVKDLPMYGNQFIPLGIKATLEERVRVAALFDKFLNGGSICHINYESTMDKETAWEKLKWIAKQGLTYSAFTTKISVCENNHAFFGHICPICGGKCITTFARIAGFYTPVGYDDKGKYTGAGTWSTARREEYTMREWEKVAK